VYCITISWTEDGKDEEEDGGEKREREARARRGRSCTKSRHAYLHHITWECKLMLHKEWGGNAWARVGVSRRDPETESSLLPAVSHGV
jgi:hypothetical protein